eukprot:GHVU01170585.1.p2 GENE.GHVU01170585.1~~GHVU01170585.1.p2  ORF type:complete len:112 (+),score=2.91 GHVU01170585.1:2037-2372(+)
MALVKGHDRSAQCPGNVEAHNAAKRVTEGHLRENISAPTPGSTSSLPLSLGRASLSPHLPPRSRGAASSRSLSTTSFFCSPSMWPRLCRRLSSPHRSPTERSSPSAPSRPE